MSRLTDSFLPPEYPSVAEIQPTWHVTVQAPREYPGAPLYGEAYDIGLDVLGAGTNPNKKKSSSSSSSGGTVTKSKTAGGVDESKFKSTGSTQRTATSKTAGGVDESKFKLTVAQAQAQVAAAQQQLKKSAQKSINSAKSLKSRAGAKKGGTATTKIANRALTVASKADSGARKLLTIASKKLIPKLTVAKTESAPAAKLTKTYMHGLDMLGARTFIGDDLSDAQAALAQAQSDYKAAKAAYDQVSSDLATARQAYDDANSNVPAPEHRRQGDTLYDAWNANVNAKENDYKTAQDAALTLIFNDSTLGDAANTLNDANALVAALQGLPAPGPIVPGSGGNAQGGGAGAADPRVAPAVQAATDAGNRAVNSAAQIMMVNQSLAQSTQAAGQKALTTAQTGSAIAVGIDPSAWLSQAQTDTMAANSAADAADQAYAASGGASGGGYGSGGGGGGDSGGGGGGSADSGGGDSGSADDGSGGNAPDQGGDLVPNETVQRFRDSGGEYDPFADDGGDGGMTHGMDEEVPMDEEVQPDEEAAAPDENSYRNAASRLAAQSEGGEGEVESVLGLSDAYDISYGGHQIQITDAELDPIRTHGSAHRGAAYLEEGSTYPPFGASAATRGSTETAESRKGSTYLLHQYRGSFVPEETIEVFGEAYAHGLDVLGSNWSRR